MNSTYFLLTFLLVLFADASINAQTSSKIYVSLNGSDRNSGSQSQPLATIHKAQQVVQDKKKLLREGKIEVIISGGIYQLDSTLNFGPADGGDSLLAIEYKSALNEKVIVSGGRSLSGTWVKHKESTSGTIWKLAINKSNAVFRSLYLRDKRLHRATSDTLFTVGGLPQFRNSYKKFDFKSLNRLVKDSIDAFCGFTYYKNDLSKLKDVDNAEIIVYQSWDASWHPVYKIDTASHVILLKSPATYPIGFFGAKVGYRVENALDFLDEPGEWCLNKKNSTVYYYAIEGEDPNKLKFTIPILKKLVSIKGDVTKNDFVQNVTFSNLIFQFTAEPWGKLDGFSKNINTLYKNKLRWIDFSQGFASRQGALGAEESILLLKAKNCKFDNCLFSHLGSYALRIGEFSTANSIKNCKITDVAAGGIIIGFNDRDPIKRKVPFETSPSFNTVSNCLITDIGIMFPSGLGIGIMQANHTTINSNKIYNAPYSGISSGWNFDFSDNFNYYNVIKNNHISNVMNVLADGGGIYTLGKQTGSKYIGNYIEDVRRSNVAVGSTNNGFFFDEGSSDFLVDSNAVKSINSKDYRFNKTDSTKIRFGKNYFEKSGMNSEILKVKQSFKEQ